MRKTVVSSLAVLVLAACAGDAFAVGKKKFIKENAEFAAAQTSLMLEQLGAPTNKNYPRTLNAEGKLRVTGGKEWTSGFFPGSLWYIYELTGKQQWMTSAQRWTWAMEPQKTYTGNHDIGFMMYCSFGNAERLTPNTKYVDILVESANTALKRYDENVGLIKSWNEFHPWSRSTVYRYPVIIDNMMNLELLFYASRITGDKKFYNVAVSHADRTLKNHFREDFSTYHVVNYDPKTGEVLVGKTAQGYSDNSTWARGQAWAIYGYTVCYRETGDKRYLDAAVKAADWWLANIPSDWVPLWDFNVDMEGYEPEKHSYATVYRKKDRDASAAAVTCSALFELAQLSGNKEYTKAAIATLRSLASPAYRAQLGTNGDFLIEHCTGSIPHRVEIDVPLVYADYYFLEALVRYKNLK